MITTTQKSLTLVKDWGKKKATGMTKRFFMMLAGCLLLTQCNTLKSDCEAVNAREQEIAAEPRGDYYVGRRYYLPLTRFWGYLREPGKSWRTAKLVIMDESVVRTPDRGFEPPVKGATFGTDANSEYTLTGSYTGEKAYDPSTDQILPVFKATSYTLRNAKPGFLFKPSEKYNEEYLTLYPAIMPSEQDCSLYPAPATDSGE